MVTRSNPITPPDQRAYGRTQLVDALLSNPDPVHQLRGYGMHNLDAIPRQQYRDDLQATNRLSGMLAQQDMFGENFRTLASNADSLAPVGMLSSFLSSPMMQGAFPDGAPPQAAFADMQGRAATAADTTKTLGEAAYEWSRAGMLPAPGMLSGLLAGASGSTTPVGLQTYMNPSDVTARISATRRSPPTPDDEAIITTDLILPDGRQTQVKGTLAEINRLHASLNLPPMSASEMQNVAPGSRRVDEMTSTTSTTTAPPAVEPQTVDQAITSIAPNMASMGTPSRTTAIVTFADGTQRTSDVVTWPGADGNNPLTLIWDRQTKQWFPVADGASDG